MNELPYNLCISDVGIMCAIGRVPLSMIEIINSDATDTLWIEYPIKTDIKGCSRLYGEGSEWD